MLVVSDRERDRGVPDFRIVWDLIQKGTTTRTCIKSRKPFLFRFRRREILKRQNYAKTGFRNLQLAIRLKQANFENPTHNLTLNYFQHLLHIHWNGFLLFILCVSNALRMKWQMRNRSGLHRVRLPDISFINIRSQSRELKETIDKDYCECGMPIENKSINVFRASRNRKKHPVTINVST